MNNFIYWKNLKNNSLDIDKIKKALGVGKINVKYFDESSGLISCHQDKEPLLLETNNTIFFSINNDFIYNRNAGEKATQEIYKALSGPELLNPNSFSNQFSYLHINKSANKVTAAIDRFGIEKIYYANNDSYFIASSSLEALVSMCPDELSISDQAVYNYIYSHVIPSPLTIYSDVYKIEPSQSITYSNRAIEKYIYWLPHFSESNVASCDDLEEQARALLNEAVIKQNNHDNTAAFLSGGLDSSTVAGYLSNNRTQQINAYTMGFEEAGYDETEYAELVAKHFDINLRNYYVTPQDVANAFSEVVRYYDEPFGNSSAIPSYLCAKFARDDGVKVMLAGDGGDEIFAGNERYAKQYILENYNRFPAFLRKNILEPLLLNSHSYTRHQPFAKIKSYIEQAITPMPDRMERYNFINHFNAKTIFNMDYLYSIDQTLPLQKKKEVYERPHDASMLNRMLYLDWKITLADNDLVKVSTACSLAGINVKYPMLDHEVVDFSTQLPSLMKMKGGKELRSFYKNAMKSFLPHEVINKKKHGFGLPFGEWLKKSTLLQERMYDNLSSLKDRHYFNNEFIDNIIQTHRTESASSYFGTMVWILAVMQEWLDSKKQ